MAASSWRTAPAGSTCSSIGSPGGSASKTPDDGGFTLIEVLIALAIAVLALGALFGLVRSALTGTARSEAYTEATVLAESTLETMGTVAPLADGDVADLRSGRFHIHATVQLYPDTVANGYLVPYALATTVSWRDGAQSRSISLDTVRLGPPR